MLKCRMHLLCLFNNLAAADSWLVESMKSAGGVIFGALVGGAISLVATRYSDAIKERRADLDMQKRYQASLDLLLSTIGRNLSNLLGVNQEAVSLQHEVSLYRRGLPRIMTKLHYFHLPEIINQLAATGAPLYVISHAMGAMQKLEELEGLLNAVKERQDATDRHHDTASPFRLLLAKLIMSTGEETQPYNNLQRHYLDLCPIRAEQEKVVNEFIQDHPLTSYFFKHV